MFENKGCNPTVSHNKKSVGQVGQLWKWNRLQNKIQQNALFVVRVNTIHETFAPVCYQYGAPVGHNGNYFHMSGHSQNDWKPLVESSAVILCFYSEG